MNNQTNLSQQELLINLIKLAHKKLFRIWIDEECREEGIKAILDILELVVNEINRLTNEE